MQASSRPSPAPQPLAPNFAADPDGTGSCRRVAGSRDRGMGSGGRGVAGSWMVQASASQGQGHTLVTRADRSSVGNPETPLIDALHLRQRKVTRAPKVAAKKATRFLGKLQGLPRGSAVQCCNVESPACALGKARPGITAETMPKIVAQTFPE